MRNIIAILVLSGFSTHAAVIAQKDAEIDKSERALLNWQIIYKTDQDRWDHYVYDEEK